MNAMQRHRLARFPCLHSSNSEGLRGLAGSPETIRIYHNTPYQTDQAAVMDFVEMIMALTRGS